MNRIEEAKVLLGPSVDIDNSMLALGHARSDAKGVFEKFSELLASPIDAEREDWGLGYVIHHIFLSCNNNHKIVEAIEGLFAQLIDKQLQRYTAFDPNDSGLLVVDQIIDPRINGLFAASNDALISLGYAIGQDSKNLFEKNELTMHSMNEMLWDEERGIYNKYDASAKSILVNESVSGFIPLIAGVPDIDQVLVMVHRAFGDDFRRGGYYSFPGMNLNLPNLDYQSSKTGAIDIATNWLLIKGLERYDMDDLVEVVLMDTLVLIEKHGFYPFFDPRKSNTQNGLGEPQSKPTAAIYLDLTKENL